VRSRRLAAIAALSISCGSITALPAAYGDTGTTLYVNNATAANCSDTTTDSATTPYCTIQAAADVVTAGQTVIVAAGTYAPFTVTASGTQADPITIEAAAPSTPSTGVVAALSSIVSSATSVAPIVVSGANYVDISDLGAYSSSTVAGSAATQISVVGSTNVTLDGIYAHRASRVDTSPVVEIDGASSAVTLSRSWLLAYTPNAGDGVQVDPGSSNDVITTNVFESQNTPILINGAPDTDVTSNTIEYACSHAIVLTGASGGSSIQNNVQVNLYDSVTTPSCGTPATPAIGIEVDSPATVGTTLDYNIVYMRSTSDSAYEWAGADYSTASELYSAVGQGQHDLNTNPEAGVDGPTGDSSPAVDSANSSAPGELATDFYGQARADDPNTPNTGAGTFTYADRGAAEWQGSILINQFTASASQAPVNGEVGFNATATNSWSAGPLYYLFIFSDGTSVQSTNGFAGKAFSASGSYTASLEVRHSPFGPIGAIASNTASVQVFPAGGAITPVLSVSDDGVLGVNVSGADSTSTTWNVAIYEYDFGDGTTGSGITASHTYSKPGTYTITLKAEDLYGDSSSTTQSFTTVASDYAPDGPTRILDTRNGTGTGGAVAKVPAGGTVKLQIAGNASIPAGVTAVALNLTATDTAGTGFVTAFADGTSAPNVSNLNYTPGRTVPNAMIVPVGADGKIDLYNGGAGAGAIDLIADVTGYFAPTAVNGYMALSPDRLLDTRNGTGAPQAKVGPGKALPLQIEGVDDGYLPGNGIAAVALNVTVTNTSGAGFISVYPNGESTPNASNLNYVAGQTVANTVIVPVGSLGRIDLYNGGAHAGQVDLIADVTGYYSVNSGGAYVPVTPTRLLDTRTTSALTKGASVSVDPSSLDGSVPDSVRWFVFNTTVTGPTGAGYITAYPSGEPVPDVSSLNYSPGLTIANLTQVSANEDGGSVAFYNGGAAAGSTQLIVDIFGYYT